MAAKYIIRKKSRYPLVFIETVGISIFLAYWLCHRYHWDWIIGAAIFIGSTALITGLFFRLRLFRYIFAIIFSLFWGFLAWGFASSVTKNAASQWVALALAFFISLSFHWGYFRDERDSDKIDIR